MAKTLLKKLTLAAAVAALVLAFSSFDTFAAAKKSKKPAAPKPAVAGWCTAHCNAFNWCHIHWSDGKGQSFPSLFVCSGSNCPPKC